MAASNEDRKPTSSSRLAVASIGVAVFLALVIAEIAVRLIFPYNSPEQFREHSVEYVSVAYARNLLKPVNRLVDVDAEKAWGAKSSDAPTDKLLFISERGYRGPSFDLRKKPGTSRIIVIGGSAVFDQNVWDTRDDVKRSWPHLIEKNLHDKGFADVEVINAGVPSHASSDSLGRLFSQLWIYEPDMILVYHGWNDIKFWGRMPVSPERPLITHVQPHDPDSNPFTTYQGSLDRLLTHSQIYMKLRNRYFVWKTDVGGEGARTGDLSTRREDEYSEYGPEQFRLNMELIVSASRSIGAIPVLISQATLVAPDNSDAEMDRIRLEYQGLSHAAVIRAYEETYKVIRDLGAKTGTPVIDVTGLMNGKGEYFSDHVHTSPEGSAKLAEIVADQLGPILAERPPGDPDTD